MPEFIIGVLGIAFEVLALNLLVGKKRESKQHYFDFSPSQSELPPDETAHHRSAHCSRIEPYALATRLSVGLSPALETGEQARSELFRSIRPDGKRAAYLPDIRGRENNGCFA